MIKIMPTFAAEFLMSSQRKEEKKIKKIKETDPEEYFWIQQKALDELTEKLLKGGK